MRSSPLVDGMSETCNHISHWSNRRSAIAVQRCHGIERPSLCHTGRRMKEAATRGESVNGNVTSARLLSRQTHILSSMIDGPWPLAHPHVPVNEK